MHSSVLTEKPTTEKNRIIRWLWGTARN